MRKIVEFNTKWAFSKEAVACPNEMPKNWVWVNLPHTWNNIDGIDGGNDYYRGTCYYANTVDKVEFLPKADQYYLEFEGANSSADVLDDNSNLVIFDASKAINSDKTYNLAAQGLGSLFVEVDSTQKSLKLGFNPSRFIEFYMLN